MRRELDASEQAKQMEIKADRISKTYGGITVLEDISFSLDRGQKIGLVGSNGAGKTTLLKIIAGLVPPDSGDIRIKKGVVVGYVPQDTSLVTNETIHEYVRRVSGIAALEKQMESSPEAISEYTRRDGFTFYHRLDVVLVGFGLGNIAEDRLIDSLSSGQKSKVFLAGMLLSDPDILLLDEPTNNLDLPALIWLEDFLSQSSATCLIVSHDRLFLDKLVTKIFEIDPHTGLLTKTSGRYSDYLIRKKRERARQVQRHATQQKEISRLEAQVRKKKQAAASGARYVGSDNDKFIRGFKRDRASKSAKRAKAIDQRISQMEIVEKPINEETLQIRLGGAKKLPASDIALKGVVAGYSKKGSFCVGPLSLDIQYGDRVAILGPNGCGKTTLLRAISTGERLLAGDISRGNNVVVGNLMQEHDNLPREESIKDFLMRRANMSARDAYTLAVKFGFRPAEIKKKIDALSPGGRSRLLFAILSYLSVNVLILDEPTNHLDLEVLEALGQSLASFKGTVILVSHDRYFLRKFKPTDTYLLAGGKLTRQESLEHYLADAERRARRLIKVI